MSKHTIIKGNCVVKQREPLFCAGLLWECSCSSSSLLQRRHSMDQQLYFPPSSLNLEDHSLPPVNSIFIILEKPGGKKHALRCFHISRRRSVVFVAKNMLKYHRFFLLLFSFPVPSPAICLQMEADSAWEDLPVLRSPCALPGSQAQCRTCDRVTVPGNVHKPTSLLG